jgi:hypothetical protein
MADTTTVSAVGQTVENTWSTTKEALNQSFTNAFNQIIAFAPRVVAMVAVLIVGYIVSRFIAGLVTTLCEKIGLQTAAQRGGVSDSMQKMGIRASLPAIVGTITFWLLMCVFLMAAFNILQLPQVSNVIQEVVNYIPHLLIATAVVVVGLLVATLLRGIIATSADRVGLSYAEHLANGCYYVMVLLIFITAAPHVGLKLELIQDLVKISFYGIAAAFALAVGLGGRDVVGGIMAGYYLRQRLQAGDHVQVGGFEGTVREVGPVATIIETNEGGLLNRHSIPNTKMLAEAVR